MSQNNAHKLFHRFLVHILADRYEFQCSIKMFFLLLKVAPFPLLIRILVKLQVRTSKLSRISKFTAWKSRGKAKN
jgi:hypothetical protein